MLINFVCFLCFQAGTETFSNLVLTASLFLFKGTRCIPYGMLNWELWCGGVGSVHVVVCKPLHFPA